MLSSSEDERELLVSVAESNRHVVHDVLHEFDVSGNGQLEASEAESLFSALARQLLREAAATGSGAAAANARELLAQEDTRGAGEHLCSAIDEMAAHLLRIADTDGDGVVSLDELARLFEGPLLGLSDESFAKLTDRPAELELYELRGSLQLLPRIARHFDAAQLVGEAWHENIAGDSHTLLRWVSPTFERDGISIVGLGRSADASCYYLPELGIALDAGLATKAFTPRTVLLTHGHRDHTQALPVLARGAPFGRGQKGQTPKPPKVLLPTALEPLVRTFLWAESQLNYGHAQTPEENERAIGALDLTSVADGDVIELPKHATTGRGAVHVEVFTAPHKDMPAVSYGLFRVAKKLKPQYAHEAHRIGELLRASPGLEVTHAVRERLIFYSGDTTIELLHTRAEEVLAYPYIIHEVTFLGPPSAELHEYARTRGHTHYAQLHPFISRAPNSIFILVHWSIRYSRADVEAFFKEQYGGVPRNVVLWI